MTTPTLTRPCKTQIGDFLVWYCSARKQLRQSDDTGQGDLEFEPESFSRSELAEAFSIHRAGISAAE